MTPCLLSVSPTALHYILERTPCLTHHTIHCGEKVSVADFRLNPLQDYVYLVSGTEEKHFAGLGSYEYLTEQQRSPLPLPFLVNLKQRKPESSLSPLTSQDLSMADPPETDVEGIEGAGREGVRSDSILCTEAK
jgi:hypothetical protein